MEKDREKDHVKKALGEEQPGIKEPETKEPGEREFGTKEPKNREPEKRESRIKESLEREPEKRKQEKREAGTKEPKNREAEIKEPQKREPVKRDSEKREPGKRILKENEPGEDESETIRMTRPEGPNPEPAEMSRERKGRKSRKKGICIGVLAFVTVAAVVVYIGIGVFYQTHFFPGTIVNNVDVSGLDVSRAAELLDAVIQGYSLEVTGREPGTARSGAVLGTVTSDAVKLAYTDSEGELAQLVKDQKWLLWIGPCLSKKQNLVTMERGSAVFDSQLLRDTVNGWAACQPENMVPAKDAYIDEFSRESLVYEIVPETEGTQLDVEQLLSLLSESLRNVETTLDLEEAGLYAEPAVRRDDVSLTAPVETANRWLGTRIDYDWNGNEVVLDAETICDWVTIENGEASLDEDAVSAFVKSCARKYDTYGKKKSFVTTQGATLKLTSASYGWRTDTETESRELLELIRQGNSGSREPVYSHKGMIKVTDSVNDVGDTYVEANLTAQHLYLYKDGEVVLETDFVSGKISNGNGTPEGIFGITYKTTDAVLRGQNYETPVKYWMPFYGNYGMHDANWRRDFGGDIYINNGSHGCINLPPSMAEQIYQYVYTGFPVVCYYYEQPVVPDGAEELPDPEIAAQAGNPVDVQPAPEQ